MNSNGADFQAEQMEGLTRRQALRKGTLLGAGAVWAAPAVRTLTMSSNFAAATSPIVDPGDTETPPKNPPTDGPGDSEDPTVNPTEPPTEVDDNEVDDKEVDDNEVDNEVGDNEVESDSPVVGGIQVTNPGANQVQSGELPLTGLDVGDTAVLAAGLMAAGAAVLKATKPDPSVPDQS